MPDQRGASISCAAADHICRLPRRGDRPARTRRMRRHAPSALLVPDLVVGNWNSVVEALAALPGSPVALACAMVARARAALCQSALFVFVDEHGVLGEKRD